MFQYKCQWKAQITTDLQCVRFSDIILSWFLVNDWKTDMPQIYEFYTTGSAFYLVSTARRSVSLNLNVDEYTRLHADKKQLFIFGLYYLFHKERKQFSNQELKIVRIRFVFYVHDLQKRKCRILLLKSNNRFTYCHWHNGCWYDSLSVTGI